MGQDFSRRASFLLPLSLVGCKKTRSPEAVSEAFIDRYYIEKNHARALELATDVAARRVAEEKRLLEQSGAGAYAGAQPRVFYNRIQSQPRQDRTEVVYALTIDAGGVKLKKEVRVEVTPAASGDGFAVASFSERDLPAE